MTPHFHEVALFVFPFTQDILFSAKKKVVGMNRMIDFERHSIQCSCALLSLVSIGRLDTSQTQLHFTLFIKSYDSEPKNQL